MSLRNQPVATRSNEDRWQAGLAFVTAVVNWLSKSADAKMRQIEARIHRLWTLYSQLHIRQQDGVGWNLTVAAGDVPPPTHYLRDLGAEAKALIENQLRRSAFCSVPELVSTIEQYIGKHNRAPKPFIWTAKASDILAKVTRARAKLNKM